MLSSNDLSAAAYPYAAGCQVCGLCREHHQHATEMTVGIGSATQALSSPVLSCCVVPCARRFVLCSLCTGVCSVARPCFAANSSGCIVSHQPLQNVSCTARRRPLTGKQPTRPAHPLKPSCSSWEAPRMRSQRYVAAAAGLHGRCHQLPGYQAESRLSVVRVPAWRAAVRFPKHAPASCLAFMAMARVVS